MTDAPEEMAAKLEARAEYYAAWARDIREMNGTSVDADHAGTTALMLRAAAAQLRALSARVKEMEMALERIERWPNLGAFGVVADIAAVARAARTTGET